MYCNVVFRMLEHHELFRKIIGLVCLASAFVATIASRTDLFGPGWFCWLLCLRLFGVSPRHGVWFY